VRSLEELVELAPVWLFEQLRDTPNLEHLKLQQGIRLPSAHPRLHTLLAAGLTVVEYAPLEGVYALGTVPGCTPPLGEEAFGAVFRLAVHETREYQSESPIERARESYRKNCDSNTNIPHYRIDFCRLNGDRPDNPVGSGKERSADLAKALACFHERCHRSRDVAPSSLLRYVAACGVLDEYGRVTRVEELQRKIDGLVREAPFIQQLILPEDNREEFDHVRDRHPDLQPSFVSSLDEARRLYCAGCAQLHPVEGNRTAPVILPPPPLDWAVPHLTLKLCRTLRGAAQDCRQTLGDLDAWTQVPAHFENGGFGYHSSFGPIPPRARKLFGDLDVFQLDINLLGNRTRVVGAPVDARLRRIDVVIVGDDAHLGIELTNVGPTCLGLALEFLSIRNLGNLLLASCHDDGLEHAIPLGGLVDELGKSLTRHRTPDMDHLAKKSLNKLLQFQFVQVVPNADRKAEESAFWHAVTRTRPDDPIKATPDSLVRCEPSEMLGAGYYLHQGGSYTVTNWDPTTSSFSETRRAHVFPEAIYMLFLLVKHAKSQDKSSLEGIKIIQRPREDFVEKAFRFLSDKTPS